MVGDNFLHFPVDFLTFLGKPNYYVSFHVFNFVFISEEKDLSADLFFKFLKLSQHSEVFLHCVFADV